MRLEFGTNGKMYAKCPGCGKLHFIRRKKNYLDKPQSRFTCRGCNLTWRPTEEEAQAIMNHVQNHAQTKTPPDRHQNSRVSAPKASDDKTPENDTRSPWQRLLGWGE